MTVKDYVPPTDAERAIRTDIARASANQLRQWAGRINDLIVEIERWNDTDDLPDRARVAHDPLLLDLQRAHRAAVAGYQDIEEGLPEERFGTFLSYGEED